jgi:glycine cleavage system H protein
MKLGKYDFPDELYYDSKHNWLRLDADGVTQGMTALGAAMAGEILYVEPAAVGREVRQGQPVLSVESGKWVGRVNAVVSGKVTAFNKALDATPELVNHDPYGKGWMLRLAPGDLERELGNLMRADSEEYRKLVEAERQKYGL